MKGPIFILLGLVGLVVLIVAIGLNSDHSPAPAQAASTPTDDCQTHAFGYLLALKEGNSIGTAYWKPGIQSKRLFGVHDFNEMGHGFMNQANGKPYKNSRIFYKYEVGSSTQGGFAIRKRWAVVMERNSKDYGGGNCAIIDLREAE